MVRRALPVVLAAALLIPTTAGAAPQLLARESGPFSADARAGIVAWSSFDPATRSYRLKVLRDGVVSTPAIAAQQRPFDVDLGRLPRSGTGAVYSRCTNDMRLTGCDVYELDLAAGVERVLDSVSSPNRSERLPSLDGGRVAFARFDARGRRSRLYVGRTTGRPASVRQPAPIAGGPHRLELARGRLFYLWKDAAGGFGRDSLFRVRGRAAVRMFSTRSGGANASDFVGLTYGGGRIHFAETNNGSGQGNRFYRATAGARRLEDAVGSSRYRSVSWTGGAFVTASGDDFCGVNPDIPTAIPKCTLERTDPIVWTPATKLP